VKKEKEGVKKSWVHGTASTKKNDIRSAQTRRRRHEGSLKHVGKLNQDSGGTGKRPKRNFNMITARRGELLNLHRLQRGVFRRREEDCRLWTMAKVAENISQKKGFGRG